MKTLLLVFLFSIGVIAWRSESIMSLIGMAKPVVAAQSLGSSPETLPAGMSLTEYAELARSDPDAYRKLLASHQHDQQRSEIDKLVNFFTRLKYE